MRWRRSGIDFNRCNNRQATRMACPDLETGLETSAFEALESTRKWKMDSGDLLLFDTTTFFPDVAGRTTMPGPLG